MNTVSRLLTALAMVTTATGHALADDMDSLNFGIISTESSQNLREVWEPFLEEMEEEIGMEVNAFFAPDYAGIIQGMRFDKVDVAWYGNKSAMEAVDRAGGEIFAQTVDVTGNPGYWSLLVAHKDSPLNSVEDIFENPGELAFGNGDPNSTSGYLVPSYYVFAKRGVQPKETFKQVLNSNHQTNLIAVATKQVDFATNNTESLARLQETHPDKHDDIKILWKSPLIPSDPIVWRKNLPETAKNKVWNFFMEYGKDGDEEALSVLADLQWAPFKASSNDQLIPIRQLSLFKERALIENDDSLSADKKAEQLAEIDAQLGSLARQMAALDARD